MNLKVNIKGTLVLTYEKKALKKVMAAAGREIAAQARANITKGGSGRRYPGVGGNKGVPYQNKPHQASAPGDSPANGTGRLRKSIVVRPYRSGEGVAIIDRAYYSASLENGAEGGSSKGRGRKERLKARMRKSHQNKTRVLAPRPFLSKALDTKRASIEARIRDSIEQDIAWKREPAKKR